MANSHKSIHARESGEAKVTENNKTEALACFLKQLANSPKANTYAHHKRVQRSHKPTKNKK